MRRILPLLIVLIASVLVCGNAVASMDDCFRATCRINVSGGQDETKGTGCVFDSDTGGNVWILTCRHVVNSGTQYKLDFWSEGGPQFEPVNATLAFLVPQCDSAVLTVPREVFGSNVPTAIPLSQHSPAAGEKITSVGCANGSWATGWQGHVLGYSTSREPAMHFLPVPADGRSGSAIFNADGTEIVAVLFARLNDSTQGLAVPIEDLTGQFSQSQSRYIRTSREFSGPLVPVLKRTQEIFPGDPGYPKSQMNATPSQCGPGGCPTSPQQGGGIFGRRQQPPQQYGARQQQQAPEQYLIPFRNETDGRLDNLEGQSGVLPLPDSRPDGLISGLLEGLRGRVGANENRIFGIEERLEILDSSLGERIIARLVEKFPFLGFLGKLGWFGPIILGGVLIGIFLLIRKDVKNRIATGDPLLIEKIAKATPWKFDDRIAEKFSERLVRIDGKVDELRDKVKDRADAVVDKAADSDVPAIAAIGKMLAALDEKLDSVKAKVEAPPTKPAEK